jgi:hypothetical protein
MKDAYLRMFAGFKALNCLIFRPSISPAIPPTQFFYRMIEFELTSFLAGPHSAVTHLNFKLHIIHSFSFYFSIELLIWTLNFRRTNERNSKIPLSAIKVRSESTEKVCKQITALKKNPLDFLTLNELKSEVQNLTPDYPAPASYLMFNSRVRANSYQIYTSDLGSLDHSEPKCPLGSRSKF